MYAFPFGVCVCLGLLVISRKVTVLMHSFNAHQVDAPKKKVNKKTVPVSEVVFGALAAPDVQKAVEELEMALQDRSMKESKDKKNDVESYVYDMRNKVRKKALILYCESP